MNPKIAANAMQCLGHSFAHFELLDGFKQFVIAWTDRILQVLHIHRRLVTAEKVLAAGLEGLQLLQWRENWMPFPP